MIDILDMAHMNFENEKSGMREEIERQA